MSNQTGHPMSEYLLKLQLIVSNSEFKNNEIMNQYETVETRKAGDEYVRAVNKTDIFDSYEWDEAQLASWLYELRLDLDTIQKLVDNPAFIPKTILDIIMNKRRQERIENYVEGNKYYANLAGQPFQGNDKIDPDPIIPVPDGFYQEYATLNVFGPSTPIHELPEKYLEIFLNSNYYPAMLKLYPNVEYLKHLGSYSIPIEKSRPAHDGDLLLINTNKLQTYHRAFGNVSVPYDMVHQFTNVYAKVHRYVYYTLKGDFANIYPNYNSFIRFLTIYMTIGNCLNEYMKRSSSLIYMNNATMNDYFMLYGLPSVIMDGSDNMVSFLKKFRLLLMDKGTNTVYRVKDLIGYEYTDIYTLIMVKQQAFKNGKPLYYYDTDGTRRPKQDIVFRRFGTAEDNTSYFKFRDAKETYTLEEITSGDPRWWNTPEVEEMVQTMNYTLSNSKYIQLSTHMSMDDIWWQSTILLRGLLDNKDETKSYQLNIDYSIAGRQQLSIFEMVLLLVIAMNWKHTDFKGQHLQGNMYMPNGMWNGEPACLDLLFNGLQSNGAPNPYKLGMPYLISSFNFDVRERNADWYQSLPYQWYLEPDVFKPMLDDVLNRTTSNIGESIMYDIKNIYKYLANKLYQTTTILEYRQVSEAYKNLFLVDPLRTKWYVGVPQSTDDALMEQYNLSILELDTFKHILHEEQTTIDVSYAGTIYHISPYDIMNTNVLELTQYPFSDAEFTEKFNQTLFTWSSPLIDNALGLPQKIRAQYRDIIESKVMLDISDSIYGPRTFEALLMRTDSELYHALMDLQSNSEGLLFLIRAIIRALERYTSSSLIALQMSALGESEYIQILKEVITYFKSYMVEFTKEEFTYIFGGPFDQGGNPNMLKLYDEMAHIKLHMIPRDVLRLYDASHAVVKFGFKEDFNHFIYDDALFRVKATYAQLKSKGYDIWYDNGKRITKTAPYTIHDDDTIVGNLIYNKETSAYMIIIPTHNINSTRYGNYPD